ncbi:class I SAM-dependent methyltransferase [Echinicola jeungdonensis]|uniref:Class I SAM-dependent methyltransferase n=1 Tax=Echinicola jeungdonensis TaxID=709343 RepID=A0ABV5J2Z9_9BACT|nr:class I SAM-dependent methyltransferase [Echinicola jeungdonensis]MDN3667824.1 class I SAM-dependent methyltransferase [Echinicola jeungdonensis]
MEEKDKYISYYDQFISDKKKEEISLRDLHILEKLVAAGLKSNHKVLDVGCGLGELSHLIAHKVRNGQVLAVDFSSESIQKATELWKKQENLKFEATDLRTFYKKGATFDFFVFSDILEQNSPDSHFKLFESIQRHAHEHSTIFIHLPTPPYSAWKAQNDPEMLQAVEPSVNIGGLIKSIKDNGFYLEQATSYSVFYEEYDYQYFIFKPLKALENPTPKGKWTLQKEKLQFNLKTLLR